jgi:hypothetical protein
MSRALTVHRVAKTAVFAPIWNSAPMPPMAVYNLSHARSRELYDLTMLQVRRVHYDGLKGRQLISAGRLLRTRFAWMARYRPLLTESELTKFVIPARNLGPLRIRRQSNSLAKVWKCTV